MHTLLLRLVAPLQSWGVDSNFDIRRTERAPSKSAIIGLLGAAQGWTRDKTELHQELSTSLRFGVRVDKEGEFLQDYQTVKSETTSYITQRFYLSDAKFLVGLEGDIGLLTRLEIALGKPYFQIFLGRRSCPPEGRVNLGIRSSAIENALRDEPLLHEYSEYRRPDSLRFLVEPPRGEKGQYLQKDQVVSFAKERREHTFRQVTESQILFTNWTNSIVDNEETEHDPFAVLLKGGK